MQSMNQVSVFRGREGTRFKVHVRQIEKCRLGLCLLGPQSPPLVHKQHFRGLLMGEWRPITVVPVQCEVLLPRCDTGRSELAMMPHRQAPSSSRCCQQRTEVFLISSIEMSRPRFKAKIAIKAEQDNLRRTLRPLTQLLNFQQR